MADFLDEAGAYYLFAEAVRVKADLIQQRRNQRSLNALHDSV